MKKLKKIVELWRELLAMAIFASLGSIILVAAMTFLPSISIWGALLVLIIFGALGGVGLFFLLILGVRILEK